MIRAVIIDDERNSRDIISLMLGKYCPQIEAVGTAANCREGIEQIRNHKPQLVFLDLEMPDGTGFDVLAGAYDASFEAIFVTAFEKRFLHTIRLSEVELILKPIDKESLLQAVGTVIKRIENKNPHPRYEVLLANFNKSAGEVRQMVIPCSQGKEVTLSVDEVSYFEGFSEKTVFYLEDGRVLNSPRSFRYYTELFTNMRFYQINNHQMVQVSHLQKVDPDDTKIVLRNKVVLEVTDRRRKELLVIWKSR
ncbi:LytR/AlgR family response regulator transcription factor [Chitinophaga niabensis]|uniref:Two component transcriptional regulator, LytTR family n=1 Tax=Chitinophaga niabensis TaxID=536979 RepID=A0A1N6JVX2_9BACT|nr:response regulator [Chitinophaga niabensis]SIO48508.1 two component transcriptional regulator, LytTR family [Chitinophaga niabensis]